MNHKKTPYTDDTIVALATATGVGAIAVIRLSGKEAITKWKVLIRIAISYRPFGNDQK